MRINFINSIVQNQYKNSKDVSKQHQAFKTGLSFKSQIPFSKLKYFTVREYEQLSVNEISVINKMINKIYGSSFDALLKYHDVAAEGIKQALDYIVGAGKYVFIPVGRSVSSIGKCLGFKIGEKNVKPLPMSQASRFLTMENCNEDFGALLKYLEAIGLSKKEIETSGKMYIFSDYCRTGKSLSGAENLFKSEKILGEQENIAFTNVLHFLPNIQPGDVRKDMSFISNLTFRDKLEDMFSDGSLKPYSLVNSCFNLNDTQNAVIRPENYTDRAKSFWFKLLDNEMQKLSKR